MITEALTYISSKINSVCFTTGSSPMVILGNVAILNDGNTDESDVILSMVNVEEEVLLRNPDNYIKRDTSIIYKNPAMHFNITIIFGAYQPNQNKMGTNYEESISKIQKIIGFFQRQNVFTKPAFPDLPDGIEKLLFELVNLNMEQLHHLWSMLGGKYIPSVVYKMRLVAIDEAPESLPVPSVGQIAFDNKIDFTL